MVIMNESIGGRRMKRAEFVGSKLEEHFPTSEELAQISVGDSVEFVDLSSIGGGTPFLCRMCVARINEDGRLHGKQITAPERLDGVPSLFPDLPLWLECSLDEIVRVYSF
jgi:hypothetical protein